MNVFDLLDNNVVNWLLEGDPSIRWQVMKDLLNEPGEQVQNERMRITTTGWGKRLLDEQDENGLWAGRLYSPKWISTTYTMLLLRRLGLDPQNQQAHKACEIFLDKGIFHDGGINFFPSYEYSETCVTGMILSLVCYFKLEDDRIDEIATHLLGQQMKDGGWNCQSFRGATHGSFHTTISVMEGLLEYSNTDPGNKNEVDASMRRGCEFLLIHRLFKSHRTGKVIDPKMTRLSFPPRWRYDILRALDFFCAFNHPLDPRMDEAIEILQKKQRIDGRWPLQSRHPGRTFFEMETVGQPSRWNTLRALRVFIWNDKNAGQSL